MTRNQRHGLSIVSNKLLHDPRLSLAAKGLFLTMLTDDASTTDSLNLATRSRDSDNDTNAALAELEAAGYIVRPETITP